MLILPKLYPDELLYSAIARFLAYCQGISPPRGMADRTTVELFGRRCRHRIDLPRYLDKVAEQTKSCWQLTSIEIAKNHTLFPYFSYGWPESIANQTLTALCSEASSLIYPIQNLRNWRVGFNTYLRYCSECRLNDIASYGETYWHRAHQLTGVFVCPKHSIALCETAVPYQPHERAIYHDATNAVSTGTTLDHRNKKNSIVSLIAIATRCTDILWGINNRWDSGRLRANYRERAVVCGFSKIGSGNLYRQKLADAFHDFYTDADLKLLGVEGDISVLGEIFSEKTLLRFHPLEHALVQIFLESLNEQEQTTPGLLGPWRCPNTIFKHFQDFPLTKVSLKTGLGNRQSIFCTCSCGFRFSSYAAREGEPDIPFVTRLKQAEPNWVKHIASLRTGGANNDEISKEMGVSVHAIERILKKPECAYEHVTEKKIQNWVNQWKKLRRKCSASDCRVNHFELYKKLKQYEPDSLIVDHAEIESFGTRKHAVQRRRLTSRVDWSERDLQWSARLEVAIARIIAARPVPLSAALIMREAGVKEMTLNNCLDKLPLCKKLLEKEHETEDDYYIRRIRYAVETMHASNEKILPSIVKRKANIVGRKLGVAAIAEFEQLTKFR